MKFSDIPNYVKKILLTISDVIFEVIHLSNRQTECHTRSRDGSLPQAEASINMQAEYPHGQTRLPKVIWKQVGSTTLVADPLIAAVYNCSTIFTRWRQCAHPSNTWFLESVLLTTSNDIWSVQPFLHGRCHILSIYYTVPAHFTAKFAPSTLFQKTIKKWHWCSTLQLQCTSTDFGNFFTEMLLREYAIKWWFAISPLLTNVLRNRKNWTGSRKFTQIPSIWWKNIEDGSSRYWDSFAHSKKNK